MKRCTPIGLALLLLIISAGAQEAGEGVLLTPRFSTGEQERYRMHLTLETESTLSPLGSALTRERPLRLAFDITWRVEALSAGPEGATRLRAVIEAIHIEPANRGASGNTEESFVGKPVTYRLRRDGGVEGIEAPEEWQENGQPAAWLRTWLQESGGAATGLPSHRVAPGEQWREEREFDVPGLPRQHLTAESQYLRNEEVNGRPCAAILTRFELKGAEVREEEAPGGVPVSYDNQVEGGGTRLSCYELRTGRLLKSTQTSREHIRLEIRWGQGKSDKPLTPTVLESRTTTEFHLQVVE